MHNHTIPFNYNGELMEDTQCSICLNQYEINQKLRRLKCFHCFHQECIDEWLKTSKKCPICKEIVNQ
uniref:RING-type domain-containing protein n=1 Tax=Arcella intermedia TaxID=1963864 RepID=A0A6B2LUE7_9EUKA